MEGGRRVNKVIRHYHTTPSDRAARTLPLTEFTDDKKEQSGRGIIKNTGRKRGAAREPPRF